MVRLLCFIGFVCCVFSWTDVYAENVRVKLASKSEIFLEGKGFHVSTETPYIKIAIPRDENLHIKREQGKWTIIRQVPSGRVVTSSSEPAIALKGQEVKKSGVHLPNNIFLSAKDEKSFDVIGILDIEEYLLGVVGSEMPSSWPIEALKAQAIAARTYTLKVMEERKDQEFHLEATVLDQVFKHSKNIGSPVILEKIREAVNSTAGLVMKTPEGELIKAFYHSDCGGETAKASDVWGNSSVSVVVTDTSCPNSTKARWSYELNWSKLNQLLKANPADPYIRVAPVYRRSRVAELSFSTLTGEAITYSGEKLRALLGYDLLRSTNFLVEANEVRVSFSGKGHGHGVGMCQHGTRAQAKIGRNFEEILKRYYGFNISIESFMSSRAKVVSL